MRTKWFHHVRQERATISFAQRSRFVKRTTSTVWYVRAGKGLNKKGLTCDHSWRRTNHIYVKRWNIFVSLQDLLLSLEKTVTSTLFHCTFNGLLQGVSRPTKYHLLWNDDDNMKTDELEQLTYYLCHMFSRCTRSVSYPAPTYNAHLAAYRARVYLEGWVCSCCHEMNRSEKCANYYTCSTVIQGWHFESKCGWSVNCGRKIKGFDTRCYVSEAFTYKIIACAWHCRVGLFRNFDDNDDNHVLLPQHPVL